MLPLSLKSKLEDLLENKFNKKIRLINSFPVAGGCINKTFKLQTDTGIFFLKYNNTIAHPKMFELEVKGLNLLRTANAINIPEVIAHAASDDISFLLLEYIPSSNINSDSWKNFGTSLAKLHKKSNTVFGLDHNNFIGSLHQTNTYKNSWIDFFIEERLEKQIALARNSKCISTALIKKFDSLYKFLPDIFPKESPSLLHGDLWNGNFILSENKVYLIDPAVYYGHREVDLAMTKLFGGFEKKFYEYYDQEFPLEKGFDKRIDIYNLYPLLVHVNLFGISYLSSVERIIKRF